jgi:hypothetical protein
MRRIVPPGTAVRKEKFAISRPIPRPYGFRSARDVFALHHIESRLPLPIAEA